MIFLALTRAAAMEVLRQKVRTRHLPQNERNMYDGYIIASYLATSTSYPSGSGQPQRLFRARREAAALTRLTDNV